jgi:hypothetical protein
MKWLNTKISGILKLALLCSLITFNINAKEQVSFDRFLLKVIDQVFSLQDFKYQSRNLNALKCIYPDAFVIQYFGKDFLRDFEKFHANFPEQSKDAIEYMHNYEALLKKTRLLFKGIKYADDQKLVVSSEVSDLIQESTKVNKCDKEILNQSGLKNNFLALLRLELYLRSRYSAQLKSNTVSFISIKPSIDLFIESLDKQFSHEYFW